MPKTNLDLYKDYAESRKNLDNIRISLLKKDEFVEEKVIPKTAEIKNIKKVPMIKRILTSFNNQSNRNEDKNNRIFYSKLKENNVKNSYVNKYKFKK